MAVEYMDGRCAVCGYDRSIQALEFHHLNPSIKVGNSHAFIREWGWERVKQQLDSCVMLCANCHREVEAGITKLD
jgi:5-methylcytosine-specific restriction endonuclease McrA